MNEGIRIPAVVIGGPPHSGKSVLTYALSQILRERNILHYLLRAYPPDGEGDWYQQAQPRTLAKALRQKGSRSGAWLSPLLRDLRYRQVPFIVDAGGKPTTEQEEIFDLCTHAIVLTPDEVSQRQWRRRFLSRNLFLLADLHSQLVGEERIISETPVLTGTVVGLERGTVPRGRMVEALAMRLEQLFLPALTLRRQHLGEAPVDLAVDLLQLAQRLEVDAMKWPPSVLPAVLRYLPPEEPLALYGRGPNWLYAAIAIHAHPAPFYLFDVRHSWLRVPQGRAEGSGEWLQCQVIAGAEGDRWCFTLPEAYLERPQSYALPPLPEAKGIVVDGKLPLWFVAMAVRYAASHAPWVAVYQPQLGGDVVVFCADARYKVGEVLPSASVPCLSLKDHAETDAVHPCGGMASLTDEGTGVL